jgi:Lipopolysaccharide kinase (Kdo/WaaP) family
LNNLLSPLRAYPLLVWDFAKAFARIPSWLRESDQALAEVAVPADFIGINVATSEDPAVDDYLLARLAELGITQVRLDYSYDSVDGPAQRLLDKLVENNYQVMLEVFPSAEDARILFRSSSARRRWKQFLLAVFSQYHDSVRCFEIGSTPNRGRWSGFSFLSYQAAWSVAIDCANTGGTGGYDVLLAGANVSDFEPFYNASFLSAMKRLGRAPQVHSDNLFVERVIEPEAYDHRVLGRFATRWLKLNLLKKARILARIGLDHGSSETVCTYKCWTAKRLARRTPWPDQKREDYMIRYLALAASSGALSRVYWGPLICSRDGLISDQMSDYPQIDQVSYYQRVRGQLGDFQINTGFDTLAHAARRLPASTSHCLLHQPLGLSLYRYTPAQGREFFLCWCRDGMSWSLSGLFSEDELAAAQYFDSCGRALARPLVINEHPLFIEFEDSAVCPDLRDVQIAPGPHTVALSTSAHQSIADREGDWRGAIMLRANAQLEDSRCAELLRPSAIPTLEETAVLRDARNRIWNVKDPRNVCDQVSVKLNRVVGFKRFSYRFRPSKGRRHWNNACEMLRRGVRTPLPVAFYEQSRNAGVLDSWYLCEFVPHAFSAKDVYAALREGADEFRGLNKREWFNCFAQFTCTMHNKQIVHRDLSAGNLLLRQTDDGSIEPHLIDIGRAWLGRGTGLSERHKLIDLIRICYKLSWQDRELFIGYYEACCGKPFSRGWRIPFHYYDYKQKFKKRLKGKR